MWCVSPQREDRRGWRRHTRMVVSSYRGPIGPDRVAFGGDPSHTV